MRRDFRLPIPSCRFRMWGVVALAAAVLGPLPSNGEAIYLQNGEEYQGTIETIAEGKLEAVVGGERRAFPLEEVQRIEFQRPRLLDDAATAADLPGRIPFFVEALEPTTGELQARFPQAGYVVLADETVVTLNAGGAWEVKRFRAWRILQDRGAGSAMRSLAYFPGREEVEVLFGLTVGPDGKVGHVADSAMKDEALYPRLPAYNFQHRLRFNLKNAEPGATLILATAKRGRASPLQPLVVDRVFWGTEPVLRQSVRLAAPEGLGSEVAVATANGLQAASEGFWEVRDAPQVFREPLMPPFEAFAPRLLVAWPKATWPALADAFRRRAGGAGRLRTRGALPRALFDQVRTQVRVEDVPLDALPDGPARPSRVLARAYGNEAERALLLAALLRGAGRPAETVLVRGRKAGPLVGAVPRLEGFDHAIVRTTAEDGAVAWLHPDSADRGFGELAPEVQGAEGLCLGTGELVAVPCPPTELEATRRTVEVQLADDGGATVRDAYVLRGDVARDYRQLKDLTQDELEKWAVRFVGSEVTGVDLLGFEHSAFERANAEERLVLRYRVPVLAEKAGKFLILRLPNASAPAIDVGRSTRKLDLFWDGPDREEVEFVVRAPAGYAIYALGEKLERKGDGWSVAASFAADPAAPGVVTFRDVWDRSALEARQDAYAAYREARTLRSRLRNEVIVFVKE